MTSLRHNLLESKTVEDAALDAARSALLRLGWSRTTLTEIARRAGVSRMTLYRRWPDMGSLLADLMTREWTGLMVAPGGLDGGDHLTRLVGSLTATVKAIRGNELFHRIIELDPELLLPYLLQRRGRSQDLVLRALTGQIRDGQQAGSIRRGDPDRLARSLVLAAHGFTLSAHTMGDPDDFDTELAVMVESYLRP